MADAKMCARAVRLYGTAEDFRDAAFILPDGRLLRWVGPGRLRVRTHVAMGAELFRVEMPAPDAPFAVYKRLMFRTAHALGDVRITTTGDEANIEIFGQVTAAQQERLLAIIREADWLRFSGTCGERSFASRYPGGRRKANEFVRGLPAVKDPLTERR